jgi:hypothetical protein
VNRKEFSKKSQKVLEVAESARLQADEDEARPYLEEQQNQEELLVLLERVNVFIDCMDEFEANYILQEDIQKVLLKHGRPVK